MLTAFASKYSTYIYLRWELSPTDQRQHLHACVFLTAHGLLEFRKIKKYGNIELLPTVDLPDWVNYCDKEGKHRYKESKLTGEKIDLHKFRLWGPMLIESKEDAPFALKT